MNPYYKNLYWGTYKENNTQCLREGRGNRPKGRNNHFYMVREVKSIPLLYYPIEID